MSTVDILLASYRFNRDRTLGLLDQIEREPDPARVLGWRPGPGRAHIGWQLLHVAVTEDIFASERLRPEAAPRFAALWPRFRGGSTPDDDLPAAAEIRRVLAESRAALAETLGRLGDEQLAEIPPALQSRGWTYLTVLHVIGWHEAHHQGQAHLTWNLYRAAQPG